jgi:hypothetical protein
MPIVTWDVLTRSEQRLLIGIFGGGSVRNQNPADIEGLQQRGLIDEQQKLSMPGLMVFTLALEQQATARRHAGAA